MGGCAPPLVEECCTIKHRRSQEAIVNTGHDNGFSFHFTHVFSSKRSLQNKVIRVYMKQVDMVGRLPGCVGAIAVKVGFT